MRSGLSQARMRERAPAEDVGALHALDRRQPRLHDADQVVGDLVVLRGSSEPKLRYIAANCASDGSMLMAGTSASGGRSARTWFTRALMSASALGGVEVQLQPDVDGRQALDALRLDVVDAVGGGDRALERRGDEAAHQVGAGADVDGASRVTVALSSFGYWRTFSVRIACSPAMMITRLTTIASTGRRMKRSVSFMAPQRFSRLRRELRASACTSLLTTTGELLRSLKAPALTTSCPAVDAVGDRDEVAARRAECARTAGARPSPACRRALVAARATPAFLSSTTNTESPYDACTIAVAGTATTACLRRLGRPATFTNMPGRSCCRPCWGSRRGA